MKTAEEIIKIRVEKEKEDWEEKGLSEYLDRIVEMYIKEVNHIRYLQKNLKGLGPVKDLKFVRKLNKTEFFEKSKKVQTETEIANLAMETVNNIFRSIMTI